MCSSLLAISGCSVMWRHCSPASLIRLRVRSTISKMMDMPNTESDCFIAVICASPVSCENSRGNQKDYGKGSADIVRVLALAELGKRAVCVVWREFRPLGKVLFERCHLLLELYHVQL